MYKGTEYRIAYTFKQSYSYKITINAACVGGTSANLRILPNIGGNGSSTSCNGAETIKSATSGDLYLNKVISGGSTWTDYTYDYPPFSTQQLILNISAVPPGTDGSQTVLIRKITIVETPPAAPNVSFDISPTSTQISCGSTQSVKFEVRNNSNTTGITDYTWNLGANNGWYYNGIPAPPTISTGVDSFITLTPVCGNVLSSVGASVIANGKAYNTTNTSTVTITQPTLSISGSSSLSCNAGDYSIAGLPCNATVTWSFSDPGVASGVQNGNTFTVTPIMPGTTNLIATILLPCGGSNVTYTQPLTVYGRYSIQVLGSTCPQSFNILVATSSNPPNNPPVTLILSTQPANVATIELVTSGYHSPQYYGSYYTVTRANGFTGQFKILAQKVNGLACEGATPLLTSDVQSVSNCAYVQTCTTVIPLCTADFSKGFAFTLPPLSNVYPQSLGWTTNCQNCTVNIVNGQYYAIPTATGQSSGYQAEVRLAFECPNYSLEPVKWVPVNQYYNISCNQNSNYPYLSGFSIAAPQKLSINRENVIDEIDPVSAVPTQTVIFPNPANTTEITILFKRLNVKTPILKTIKGDEIRIETLTGHILSVTPITNNASQIKINVANVANGMYLVKITRGTTVEIQKLIIAK